MPGPVPTDVSLHRLGGPWADGAIVSNAHDLAVFFGALLRGKLVPARGRRFFVVDWNGVSPAAIDAMDRYLDALLCR
jgi:hypothetical protein